MERLIKKYLNKIQKQGLSTSEDTIIIAFDDKAYSNQSLSRNYIKVFDSLNINTLLVSRPAEPYLTIIKSLTKDHIDTGLIKPVDCETRTFFHDIPVIKDDTAQSIISALSRRKSAVTLNGHVITYGTVSPEQAYVAFSSTCFSLFVKYLFDIIHHKKKDDSYTNVLSFCNEITDSLNLKELKSGLFLSLTKEHGFPHNSIDKILNAMIEAGKALVDLKLVDSYFGNISCLSNGMIYISQTGSSLDELEDAIDIVPIDGTSTNAITASSEYTAHRLIYEKTDFRYILHGHPRFSVIMSMFCDRTDCRGDNCYRSCTVKRMIGKALIVSGEIGTGRWGLLNTVPQGLTKSSIVAVYGHGVFTASREGFHACLKDMIEFEDYCLREYKKMIIYHKKTWSYDERD